jgi:hypothetical protein
MDKPWLEQRIRIIPSPAGFVDPHPLNRKVRRPALATSSERRLVRARVVLCYTAAASHRLACGGVCALPYRDGASLVAARAPDVRPKSSPLG